MATPTTERRECDGCSTHQVDCIILPILVHGNGDIEPRPTAEKAREMPPACNVVLCRTCRDAIVVAWLLRSPDAQDVVGRAFVRREVARGKPQVEVLRAIGSAQKT